MISFRVLLKLLEAINGGFEPLGKDEDNVDVALSWLHYCQIHANRHGHIRLRVTSDPRYLWLRPMRSITLLTFSRLMIMLILAAMVWSRHCRPRENRFGLISCVFTQVSHGFSYDGSSPWLRHFFGHGAITNSTWLMPTFWAKYCESLTCEGRWLSWRLATTWLRSP